MGSRIITNIVQLRNFKNIEGVCFVGKIVFCTVSQKYDLSLFFAEVVLNNVENTSCLII